MVRQARLVPVRPGGLGSGAAAAVGGPAAVDAPAGVDAPVDVRITDGVITAVGPRLPRAAGEEVLEAEGRWAVPGLWDNHVHMGQWAATFGRLNLSAAVSATEVLDLVTAALARRRMSHTSGDRSAAALVGFGFRDALWADRPSLAALDAVAAGTPVVLLSGDVHCGWVSSTARALLGLPAGSQDDGLVRETPWFEALPRLATLPGTTADAGYREALTGAAARGVVGVVDFEFAPNEQAWPERINRGLDLLRVRTGVYPDHLQDVLDRDLRAGMTVLGSRGLVTMGPLKVITDGALNTRTAHCRAPYPVPGDPAHPRGVQAVPPDELEILLHRATEGGLKVAVHAIGDAAVGHALAAFTATGAYGSIEHAQLVTPDDVAMMVRLGVVASVQPAHLLDDRDVADRVWPGRTRHAFAFRDLLDAGVVLALGSDAPVAPLDPWLAMAAAVHRSGDDRAPWHPEQQLTAAEALGASTDRRGTLAVGSAGDVALLDADPLAPSVTPAEAAARLRGMRVAATLVAGRVTHDAR
ncbi:amidohydrolase family protein [Georgenia yuyongxinii]|uniref:Amidohydrolase family protein n=1 Tax=Georgenia yuyongxinii TaxID=2589797 RepID=A0A552WRF5_9MICO|nr:amidohydrolase family protein [Georgenia yuyongxinii]